MKRFTFDATQAYTVIVEAPDGTSLARVNRVLRKLALSPGMEVTDEEVGADLVPAGFTIRCSDGEREGEPVLSEIETILDPPAPEPEGKPELRIEDVITGRAWRVVLVRKGSRYGRNDCLTHDKDDPLVEFWDLKHADGTFGPGGQFVSRYYLSTLFGAGTKRVGGLQLEGSVDAWHITGPCLRDIEEWLRSLIK